MHETTYQRKKSKEVLIDNLIRIGLIDGDYVGEVKSSSKMVEAYQAQLLYYLFVLNQMGIQRKGKIHYPKEKRVDVLELTEQDKQEIPKWLAQIQKIIQLGKPVKKDFKDLYLFNNGRLQRKDSTIYLVLEDGTKKLYPLNK